MQTKTYLSRYLITVDQYQQPIKLRQADQGVVYKAFDSVSNREVALEVIPALGLSPAVRERLEAEGGAAKQIKHINVPMLYDVGVEEEELVYASEFADGVSAEQWVKTHGPMPLGSALRIASQVVSALRAATFHGIVHHAVNPANILIVPGQTAEGEWPLIKVMNFIGLAPSYSRAEAFAAGVSEAVNFASPEQLETGKVDFHSEMYSLGCTLWFLLSGVPPLAGASTVENAKGVPSPVRSLLAQMLAHDPQERPSDPVALHEQIEQCIGHYETRDATPLKSVAPVVVTEPPLPIRERRPFPWQPLAVAAVLLLLAGIAAMAWPHVRSRFASNRAIGVPVGVPEKAPERSASTTTQSVVTRPAPPNQNDNNVAATTTTGQSRPVLTSSAGVADEEAEQAAAASAEARPSEQEPTQVAAIAPSIEPAPSAPEATVAPVQQNTVATTPAIASNDRLEAEPDPPTEGPPDEPAVVQAAPPPGDSYASVSRQTEERGVEPSRPVASASSAPNETTREREPVEARAKSARVAKAEKPPLKKERVVASQPPPKLPRGSVRAQYLGTTPDGELVFGLPSDQRGYVASPAVSDRQSRRRERRLPVRAALPPDGLPVLPALPAEQ